jgi:hypothetical protein
VSAVLARAGGEMVAGIYLESVTLSISLRIASSAWRSKFQ